MARRIRAQIAVPALALVAFMVSFANAHSPRPHSPASYQGGAIDCVARSIHPNEHPDGSGGEDSGAIFAEGPNWPDSEVWIYFLKLDEATQTYKKAFPVSLKKPLSFEFETPFTITAKTAAEDTLYAGANQQPAYRDSAWDERGWDHPIEGTEGQYYGYYGDTSVKDWKPPCHMEPKPVRQNPSASLHPALVMLARDNGVATMVENESGEWVHLMDSEGWFVWETAPTVALRFTSSVSGPQSGNMVYTYTIDNYYTVDRDFLIRELTTQQFPTGWSGVVPANDSVTLSFTAADTGSVFTQNTEVNFTNSNDASVYMKRTENMYTPPSKVTYNGTNTMVSAAFSPTPSRNVVTFTVSSPATKACLYHVANGELKPVSVVNGVFAPGNSYILEHLNPLPGLNRYVVATGIRTNWYQAETVDGLTVIND